MGASVSSAGELAVARPTGQTQDPARLGVSGLSHRRSSAHAVLPEVRAGQERQIKGPCRGLSVRQTIVCAEHLWPVPGGLEQALYIAHRESRFLPLARNGSHYGVYQIAASHIPRWPNSLMVGEWWNRWFPHLHRGDPNILFNGRFNVMLAIRHAHLKGWGPWQ